MTALWHDLNEDQEKERLQNYRARSQKVKSVCERIGVGVFNQPLWGQLGARTAQLQTLHCFPPPQLADSINNFSLFHTFHLTITLYYLQ